MIADQAAVGDAQSHPFPDERDDQAHDLEGPIVRQGHGPAGIAEPCELNPANQAGAGEKTSRAQSENSGPNPGQPMAGGKGNREPGRKESWHPAVAVAVSPRLTSLHAPGLPGGLSRAPAEETLARHTQHVREILDLHSGKLNETLDRLAVDTRHQRQQTIALVESIVASHGSLQTRLAQLEAQLASHRNHGTSG